MSLNYRKNYKKTIYKEKLLLPQETLTTIIEETVVELAEDIIEESSKKVGEPQCNQEL